MPPTRKQRGIFSTLGNLVSNAVNTVSKVAQDTLDLAINIPTRLVSRSKDVVRNSLKSFTNGTSRVVRNVTNGTNSMVRRVVTRRNQRRLRK